RGQLRGTTAVVTLHQAVEAREQKGLVPGIETRRAEAPALTHHRHRHRGHQEVAQHSAPSHQTRSLASIGLLKPAVGAFDGRPTELYIEAHGSILTSGLCGYRFLSDTPCAHGDPS